MKRVLLPIVIVLVGFGVAALLIVTGPRLEPRAVVSLAPLVRVVEVVPGPVQMSARTHGTVAPRTESDLVPEVSGSITAISPAMVSGGYFRQGELLVRLDALDYEVALEQAKAGISRGESELNIARKAHARQLDLAEKQSSSASQKDDALNRLRIAEASLRDARARLSKAERDLMRTAIRAPYEGRVRTEHIDVGQFVNRGSAMATIYAIDFAEVRLPIHDEELEFLNLSLAADDALNAAPVEVSLTAKFGGAQHEWTGQVVRTEGELDPRTRMLHVVARVTSPYEVIEGRPPLKVGMFVNAEIRGREFEDVVVLPRVALRDNSQVFVVDNSNRLRFRSVDVLRVVEESVYVSGGLSAGERVCVSPLNNAVEGMPVRVPENQEVARS